MKKPKRWIQKAHIKKGALSRQLGIPVEDKIPMHILEKVKTAKVGARIKVDGKVPVTRLLKRRANLALTLKRIK